MKDAHVLAGCPARSSLQRHTLQQQQYLAAAVRSSLAAAASPSLQAQAPPPAPAGLAAALAASAAGVGAQSAQHRAAASRHTCSHLSCARRSSCRRPCVRQIVGQIALLMRGRGAGGDGACAEVTCHVTVRSTGPGVPAAAKALAEYRQHRVASPAHAHPRMYAQFTSQCCVSGSCCRVLQKRLRSWGCMGPLA